MSYTRPRQGLGTGHGKSHEQRYKIRVIRRLKNPQEPMEPYQYDGLYEIDSHESPDERNGLYRFHLCKWS
jgi:hypothetical protein